MIDAKCSRSGTREADPDIRARLAPGDALLGFRKLVPTYRTPPLSTARTLLALGRVSRLDDLGAAGPLHAATTGDEGGDADPELRKFEAIFARDALRVTEFIGTLFPGLRWATVHALARVQGLEHDTAREEEPGKIVHEWRDPADPVAQRITAENGWGWPYYGAVDTTPLFISAVSGLLKATPVAGAVEVKQRGGRWCKLTDSLAAAVTWLCHRVDEDLDGLLTYRRLNPRGIENQTWRDSWDSLSHADGTMPNRDHPIAALDVQVLAHDALIAASRHYRTNRTSGDKEFHSAGALTERTQRIRTSVLERFWVDDIGSGFFAAALDYSATGLRRPLRTRISDMGHLLNSELLCGNDVREYRDAVVRQLFSPSLLCSAGIRSLHADEVRYWPGGYHTGNSWLWQTMHIADGLAQHGLAWLAKELRNRCRRVHLRTGLLPEFARGDDSRGILNDRIIDLWQAADGRKNRLEQSPQQVQAWTVASLHAEQAVRFQPLPPPTHLERGILADLPNQP